jgi:DNA-binding response OmpR family regulator
MADDDPDFLDVTAYGLRRAGFEVDIACNGEEALASWRNDDHDIVLLDVNMPELPGIQMCEVIRSTSSIPVVLMSGNRRESEVVRGFEAGADDYIGKPFSLQQLVMRLRAIHRRTSGQTTQVTPRHLVLPPLVVDLDSFSLTIEGQPVRLTRLEFRLFYCLAANAGRVVSTSHLIDFGWGLDGEGDVSLLKTHFSHIRSKISEVSSHPITIRALPGAGYSLHIETPAGLVRTRT